MNGDSLDTFRAEVRAWLIEQCPVSMRTPMPESEVPWEGSRSTSSHPDSRIWRERMAGRGWIAPTWPVEYGGAGLSPQQALVLEEELRRIHARPTVVGGGVPMLGPVLLEFGSEELKRDLLPRIARAEIRWAQGFSEPGAGSDLASLRTRAKREGDHYVLNGQKTWTTYADLADWMFCAVRTDPHAAKHDGISFILFPMDTPGIRTSRIEMISGTSHFCQTLLDNVRVPVRGLVGKEGQGWTIIRRLLQNEREWVSSFLSSEGSGFGLGQSLPLPDLARAYLGEQDGQIADPVLRDAVARQEIQALCMDLTARRAQQEGGRARVDGFLTSLLKYAGAAHSKAKYELLMACLGVQGIGWEGEGYSEEELRLTRGWLRSKANSIEGGTSEVQLNVIARRILNLPE